MLPVVAAVLAAVGFGLGGCVPSAREPDPKNKRPHPNPNNNPPQNNPDADVFLPDVVGPADSSLIRMDMGFTDSGVLTTPDAGHYRDSAVDAAVPEDSGVPTDMGTMCRVPPMDCDGDGYRAIARGGDDCNDNLNYIHPNATERLDGRDGDCDNPTNDPARRIVPLAHGIRIEVSNRVGQVTELSHALGDITGDGVAEVIVGVPGNGVYGLDVRGIEQGSTIHLPDSHVANPRFEVTSPQGVRMTLPASAGFVIEEVGTMSLGSSVAVVPDVDGDGINELWTGAKLLNSIEGDFSSSGGVFTFQGRPTFNSKYTVSYNKISNPNQLTAMGMALIKGENGFGLGARIYVLGDVDRALPLRNEILLPASEGARAPVIRAVAVQGVQNVTQLLDRDSGYYFEDDVSLGYDPEFSGGADIDSDGLMDFVYANPSDIANSGHGIVKVIFGGNWPMHPSHINPMALTSQSAIKHATFFGAIPGHYAGSSLAMGHFNRDNYGDLSIGVRGFDHLTGAIFTLSGADITQMIQSQNGAQRDLNGPLMGGQVYQGQNLGDKLGTGGLAAGDIDGNGYPDLVVGSVLAHSTQGGMDLICDLSLNRPMPGNQGGIQDFADERLNGQNPGDAMGRLFPQSIGDATGDGVGDVLVSNRKAVLHLFPGGPER